MAAKGRAEDDQKDLKAQLKFRQVWAVGFVVQKHQVMCGFSSMVDVFFPKAKVVEQRSVHPG